MSGEPMRGFDRAMRQYEDREPIHRCEHGVDLYQRTCSMCEEADEPEEEEVDEPPAVFLGVVGSVGTLLFWLFLSTPQ